MTSSVGGQNTCGIYIHIPFCRQACHYCDFHFSTNLKPVSALVTAINQELILRAADAGNKEIPTIYLGGGTPSLLDEKQLQSILDTIAKHYTLGPNPEVTLELNPEDVTHRPHLLANLKKLGFNRLSIGIQSFIERDLKMMNRAHNASEAKKVLTEAVKHFENLSADLIYGIPETSDKEWMQNVTELVDMGIPHISAYALTVEPKTALNRFIEKGLIAPVDDEQAQRQFYLMVDFLQNEGYIHYEISNFGKPNYFSQNNSAYWQGKPYLGIGPSAHSFNGLQRAWNLSNNHKYIKSLASNQLFQATETLTTRDQYNETIMTGLRTIWGVNNLTIAERFGDKYADYLEQQAKPHVIEQLLFWDGAVLLATKKGKFLVDGIAADLFMINLEEKES